MTDERERLVQKCESAALAYACGFSGVEYKRWLEARLALARYDAAQPKPEERNDA